MYPMLFPLHQVEVQLLPPGLGAKAPAVAFVVVETAVQFGRVPPVVAKVDPTMTFEFGPLTFVIGNVAVSNEGVLDTQGLGIGHDGHGKNDEE